MADVLEKLTEITQNLGYLIGEGLHWCRINFEHVWAVLHHGNLAQQVVAAIAVIALAAFFAFLLIALIRAIVVSIYPLACMIVSALVAILFLNILSYV